MKLVILHNIRSHYNVGAILRTADAAGVSRVYFSGITPLPVDRFGRAVPEISKTALGAEISVPSEAVPNLPALIMTLQNSGVTVVAVEQALGSISLPDFVVPDQVAYLMGSETDGVEPDILALVDAILELPMLGTKESLNVSVTAGIVLYHR